MKDLGAGEFPLNHYDEPLNKLIPSLNKKGGVSQVLDTKTFLGSFPEFSKTVLKDDKGDLIPLYHGTSKDKDFGSSFAKSKRGIFLSKDPNVANEYAKQNDSQDIVYEGGRFVHKNTASRVIPVYAKIENPYTLEGEEAKKYMYSSNYATAQRKIMEEAIAKGHDAVLYPDGAIVVADPRQIESAITTTTKAALAKRLKELGDKK
jgi:hypothetical protein